MTTDDVRARVDRLRMIAGDDEAAHSEEDALYEAVLQSIADGTAADPVEMARMALTTVDIDFARWCA